MLEASGYRAHSWASAVDLLRALPALEPGCIVADVRMPEMDGLMLLGELRARNVKLPVIVITGHGEVPVAVHAMKAGAVDFIEKPFAKEQIIESIRMALRQASPFREHPPDEATRDAVPAQPAWIGSETDGRVKRNRAPPSGPLLASSLPP